MTFKYKRELSIIGISFVLCLSIFTYIKSFYFKDKEITEPITSVMKFYNEGVNEPKFAEATTKLVPTTTTTILTTQSTIKEEEQVIVEEVLEYPYSIAPEIIDDGSIVYEGMTVTELTNQLNKSLSGYMTNTGYFFAKYTKDTGIDPYLSVAIVLLETGCKWNCSTLTVKCNNIGGLKGGESCNGGSYSKYETLDIGIESYLNIIYNNYYLKGLDTADKMASKYAESPEWSMKVNRYIEEIRNK